MKPSPGSGSRPLPTFASILRNAELNEAGDGKTITLDYEYFRNVLRAIVHQTPFDRELYLRRHPNLQNAERTGVISAAHAHWVYSGYLEGRTLFGWETFDFTPDEILKAPQSFFDELRQAFAAENNDCFADAEMHYLAAIAAYDRSVWGHVALAKFYFRTKRLLKSQAALRHALDRDASCGPARDLMSDLAIQWRQNYRALSFAASGDHPTGDYVSRIFDTGHVRRAKRLLKTATGDEMFRGFVRSKADARFAELVRLLGHCNRLRKKRPLDGSETAELALCLAQLGYAGKAAELAESIIGAGDLSAGGLARLIDAIRIARGLEAAADLIDKHADSLPRNAPMLRKKRLEIAYEMDDLPRVRELAQSYAELSTDYPVFERYAYALIRAGETSKALQACREHWHFAEPHRSVIAIALKALREEGRYSGVSFETSNRRKVKSPRIPNKIFQFWDRENPPVDVATSMQTWSSNNPDFKYERFSEATARQFLLDSYGAELAGLFDFCHHPAMKCDLFRVAYLGKEGGWYADADEVNWRPLRELVEAQPECDLFLSIGDKEFYLNNRFMAARPEHPIIQKLLTKITEALSEARTRGETPNIWESTGPGQVSYVVAEHLLTSDSSDELTARFGFLYVHTLEQFTEVRLLGYKQTTSGNWRAGAYGLSAVDGSTATDGGQKFMFVFRGKQRLNEFYRSAYRLNDLLADEPEIAKGANLIEVYSGEVGGPRIWSSESANAWVDP